MSSVGVSPRHPVFSVKGPKTRSRPSMMPAHERRVAPRAVAGERDAYPPQTRWHRSRYRLGKQTVEPVLGQMRQCSGVRQRSPSRRRSGDRRADRPRRPCAAGAPRSGENAPPPSWGMRAQARPRTRHPAAAAAHPTITDTPTAGGLNVPRPCRSSALPVTVIGVTVGVPPPPPHAPTSTMNPIAVTRSAFTEAPFMARRERPTRTVRMQAAPPVAARSQHRPMPGSPARWLGDSIDPCRGSRRIGTRCTRTDSAATTARDLREPPRDASWRCACRRDGSGSAVGTQPPTETSARSYRATSQDPPPTVYRS